MSRYNWSQHAAKDCACCGRGERWDAELMAFALCSCIPDDVAARVQRETAREHASKQIAKSGRHAGAHPAAEMAIKRSLAEPPVSSRSNR
jgi:hypothetical protein